MICYIVTYKDRNMAVGAVVQGLTPMVFATLNEPHVRMAIWSRPCPPDAADCDLTLPLAIQCHGPMIFPSATEPEWLIADMEKLGDILAAVAGSEGWAGHCERTDERVCPRFHQDAVTVRLITAYRGPGPEWAFASEIGDDLDGRDAEVRRRVRTLAPGEVAIMKGAAGSWAPWPDLPVVLHRSPPASKAAPRLVLTIDPYDIDLPDAIGLAAE
jgi:hypothetical protein